MARTKISQYKKKIQEVTSVAILTYYRATHVAWAAFLAAQNLLFPNRKRVRLSVKMAAVEVTHNYWGK